MVSPVQFSSIHIRVGGSANGLIPHRLEGADLEFAVAEAQRRRENLKNIREHEGNYSEVPEVDPEEIAQPKPKFNDSMLPQWATVEVTSRGDRITFSDYPRDDEEICGDNAELRRKVADLGKHISRLRGDEIRRRMEEIINLIANDAMDCCAGQYFVNEKARAVLPEKRPVEDRMLDYLHTIRAAVSSEGKGSRRVRPFTRATFRSPGCEEAQKTRSGYWPDLLK